MGRSLSNRAVQWPEIAKNSLNDFMKRGFRFIFYASLRYKSELSEGILCDLLPMHRSGVSLMFTITVSETLHPCGSVLNGQFYVTGFTSDIQSILRVE